MKRLPGIIFAIIIITCSSYVWGQIKIPENKIDTCIQKARKIKSEKKYEFKMGKTFKYDECETGEVTSANGITIVGDDVYIGDEFENSIKKINIKTGELKTGSKVKLPLDQSISDIAYLNGKIYAITSDKTILVFNADLQLITKKTTPNYGIAQSTILYSDNDSLEFAYYDNETIRTMKVYKNSEIITDSIKTYGYDLEKKVDDHIFHSTGGKLYKVIEKDSCYYLGTQYGCYETKKKIDYGYNITGRSFDYTKDRIVFFEVNAKKFTLNIYEY
jgi:hypothetical protein